MELAEKKYKRIIAGRKRRAAKRKFFLFLRILLMLVFFTALIWGFNYFYNSSYFKISSIIIKGNFHYDSELIKKEAEVVLGLNIFEIDKKYVEEKLEKNLIWLKSASLKKVFPNKIEIEITERKPYLKLVYGGRYYLIDDSGVILEELTDGGLKDYNDLLLLKNAVKYYPEIGERIAKKNILGCGQIFQSLDLEIKSEIKEAFIDDNYTGDIIFVTSGGKRIIFGTSDRLLDKNTLLRQILGQLSDNDSFYSYIDLRDVENPVIK
ncbi:MAG: FtsQ-type POTRA domain-containing protein [Actinobacteria bacterium]|nr:FtsQ-type POTRA domain-containing protein [Actinomycetota bacterium]